MKNPNTRCLKEPIPEIYEAAGLLVAAADAHIAGNINAACELIKQADMPIIRDWTESIWGIGGIYSNFKKQYGEPKTLLKDERDPLRMPNKQSEKDLLARDGHNCRFCGIPVIRREVRVALHKLYPEALKWGSKNPDQHAAFQAMWLQYDHVIPHARGGKTTLDNMLITCAPCNYGRMNFLLEEIGIDYPTIDKSTDTVWDGLERILRTQKKSATNTAYTPRGKKPLHLNSRALA